MGVPAERARLKRMSRPFANRRKAASDSMNSMIIRALFDLTGRRKPFPDIARDKEDDSYRFFCVAKRFCINSCLTQALKINTRREICLKGRLGRHIRL
jgi:hypothetical protein